MTDFGLAKRNVTTPNGATTFVGSPEYVAPEVLARGRYGYGYGKAVDWWSLGTLIYEMLNGLPPFYDRNRQVMFEQIRNSPLIFPPHFSASAQAMLKGLLTRNPANRLGSGDEGSNNIRSSPFFTNIDWVKLEAREVVPPWVPKKSKSNYYLDETDSSNFDTRGVSMTTPGKSLPTGTVSNSSTPLFSGFTFVPENEQGLSREGDTVNELELGVENPEGAFVTDNGTEKEELLFALSSAMKSLEKEMDPKERVLIEDEILHYRLALESSLGGEDDPFDDFDEAF